MNNDSVSIIIPIYNAESYLERCLNSLNEKTENDEIILVNDGSKDNSISICEKFREDVKNVTLINQRNKGVSAARNAGIDAATRSWIMFVDADDYLIPGWRKIIQESLEIANETNVVVFERNIRSGFIEMKEGISAALGYNRSLGTSLGFPVSKLFKTEMIQNKNIYFSEKLINGEDMIFNAKAFAVSGRGFAVPQSIYAYYKNMSSATNRFDVRIVETEHEFHRELHQLFYEHNLKGKEWEDIEKLSFLNGLYVVAYRIVLGGKKENIKLLEKLISENEYKNALSNLANYRKCISTKIYPALYMLSKGKNELAIKYIRIICLLKKIYYIKKKDSVIHII